ncbi:M20/M25/M40 family metallo-hydrolase [Streptomyces sp. NPDC004111]|uniref:M20/M25/M40 family metallo-hydrolase n=1 Tax=Streptomyces sp. NPDC004111 TaxID=3364690 RepID=UPI00367D325E
MNRTYLAFGSTLAVGVLLAGCGGTTSPSPAGSVRSSGAGPAPAVRTADAIGVLDALQKAADDNGGNRASGRPGFDASLKLVRERLEKAGLTTRVEEFTVPGSGRRTANLLAELPGTAPDKVLMAGAHLDSVDAGPGINDNGSGVAVLVAAAEAMSRADSRPARTVRFAFWGAEEQGLAGSLAHVSKLAPAEASRLVGYVNFDMTATKGGHYGILDARKESLGRLPEQVRPVFDELRFPAGSDRIQKVLESAYRAQGATPEPDLTTAASTDSYPFQLKLPGVPVGGIVMLNEQPVTKDGVLLFAPCYHQACDGRDNIDEGVLEKNLRAAHRALTELAA